MGPQHPSTHGVLRVMLELEGETVLRSKPVIGYLHTGMEKTAEDLMYIQGSHQRHPDGLPRRFFNETVFSMAVEELLGIEVPAAGHVDPHAHVRAEPASRRTCCSWPPTAWTSAPSR